MAGSTKHRWTWIVKYAPDHFKGKGMPKIPRKRMKEINVWEINKLILDGGLEKGPDGRYLANLPEFKVLGTGKLDFPVVVRAGAFSKGAVEKIKGAGGEAKPAEGSE